MDTPKFLKAWIRQVKFRGFSIQQRLPLLICALLLGVVITFGLISFVTVKRAALKTGRNHLNSVTQQLSDILGQSANNMVALTKGVAEHYAIKKLLRGEHGAYADAMQSLKSLQKDSNSVLVELRDINLRPIIRSPGNYDQDKINFDSIIRKSLPNYKLSMGNIYQFGGSMYYPVIASVTDSNKVAGYVVRWRKMVNTSRSLEQLSHLMGSQASLYLANNDNSLCTDLKKPVPNPLPSPGNPDFNYRKENGTRVMAATKNINNTPWYLIVEFSRTHVMESANNFLWWVIIIGSLLIIAGFVLASIMSRNITGPLNELTAAASGIAAGNYSSKVAVDKKDEVGKLARAFNAMAAQVNSAKIELEQKIVESNQFNEQLRNLSAHLQNIREEERIHIAREMHDELGQFLTGLKMDISWMNKKLGSGFEKGAAKEKLDEMSKMVDEAVVFVRRLAAELRPSILDDLGLIPALEWHSQEFTRRFNIDVQFNAEVESLNSSPLVATGLFRMYQESLTNVARHAEATTVIAKLQVIDDQVQLSVTDNGKGFEQAPGKRKTLGLLGMKERALMLGGRLEIFSKPGKGTTVLITVPFEQDVNMAVR